jgi:hypothetical protein
VVRNVVLGSPLHSRGIGLEGDTHSMFVKRKLDANSNRLDMGIFTINIPMKNCLLAIMHKSLDLLCAPFFGAHLSVGNTIQNNSDGEISTTLKVPPYSHNCNWCGNMIRDSSGGDLCSIKSMASSTNNRYNNSNLL